MGIRLILLDVEVRPLDDPKGPYEGHAVLGLQGRRIIGSYIGNENEDELLVTAKATLAAVQKALPISVTFVIRNAVKLTPQFLDTPLMIVITDLLYGNSKYELTGACQCEESALARGIAQAALDATNRLVQFIFAEQSR